MDATPDKGEVRSSNLRAPIRAVFTRDAHEWGVWGPKTVSRLPDRSGRATRSRRALGGAETSLDPPSALRYPCGAGTDPVEVDRSGAGCDTSWDRASPFA